LTRPRERLEELLGAVAELQAAVERLEI